MTKKTARDTKETVSKGENSDIDHATRSKQVREKRLMQQEALLSIYRKNLLDTARVLEAKEHVRQAHGLYEKLEKEFPESLEARLSRALEGEEHKPGAKKAKGK